MLNIVSKTFLSAPKYVNAIVRNFFVVVDDEDTKKQLLKAKQQELRLLTISRMQTIDSSSHRHKERKQLFLSQNLRFSNGIFVLKIFIVLIICTIVAIKTSHHA